MMKAAFDFYRPTRTDDGEGGYTETYSSPVTIWGMITVYKEETQIYVNAQEDVRIGDVVEVEEFGTAAGGEEGESYYRVIAVRKVPQKRKKIVMLESINKPTFPEYD